MTSPTQYRYTESQANAIKILLDELRISHSSSDKTQTRRKLRESYNFYVSNFEPGLTSEMFDRLVAQGTIHITSKSPVEAIAGFAPPQENSPLQFVSCPQCASQLSLSKELFDRMYIICSCCGSSFKNPIAAKRNKKTIIRFITIILFIAVLVMYCGRSEPNSTKTIELRDRTEIYYYNHNADIFKKETRYKDGRPDKCDYY